MFNVHEINGSPHKVKLLTQALTDIQNYIDEQPCWDMDASPIDTIITTLLEELAQ